MKLITTVLIVVLILCALAEIGLLFAAMQVMSLGEPVWNIVGWIFAVAVLIVGDGALLVALKSHHTPPHDPGRGEHAEGGRRAFWSQGEYWETRTSSSGEERLVRKMKQQNRDHPEPRRGE